MSSLINLGHNFIFEVRKISRAVNYARRCKTARISALNEQYRALFQPTQLGPTQMGGTWKELGEKKEDLLVIQHLEPKHKKLAPNFQNPILQKSNTNSLHFSPTIFPIIT